MINKGMLQHLMFLGIPKTEIAKSFNAGRALVSRWIKFHQFSNVLSKPEDNTEIIKILREMKQFHSSVEFRCAVGCLAKGVKAKKVRLNLVLKTSKILSQLKWISLHADHAGIGMLSPFSISVLHTN